MTARVEQETTITVGRDTEFVQVWSYNPVHLRRLRKDARVQEVSGDSDAAWFRIPTELYNPLAFRRKGRVLTPVERAAAAARLQTAREAS